MTNGAIQTVLQRIEDEDPLDLMQTCGMRWQVESLEERRYSSIHILRPEPTAAGECLYDRLGSRSLILKLYRAPQAQRRQKEFDDLCRVYDALANGTHGGIARPVAVYPELGAILTVRAPGASAGPLIREACRNGGNLEQLARAASICVTAGTWLREFQRRGAPLMSGQRSRDLGTTESFLSYIDARLQLLCRLHFGIASETRQRLLEQARSVLVSLPVVELKKVTWSHADFGPHNLLADGDSITVLDFELAPEHPCFDAAYFLEALAGLDGPLMDTSRIARLQSAFLSAYGNIGSKELVDLYRLRHLVCSYVSQSRQRGLARVRAWPGLLNMRNRLQRMSRCEALSA